MQRLKTLQIGKTILLEDAEVAHNIIEMHQSKHLAFTNIKWKTCLLEKNNLYLARQEAKQFKKPSSFNVSSKHELAFPLRLTN